MCFQNIFQKIVSKHNVRKRIFQTYFSKSIFQKIFFQQIFSESLRVRNFRTVLRKLLDIANTKQKYRVCISGILLLARRQINSEKFSDK